MDYLVRLRQSRRPTFWQHVSVLLGSGIILLTVVLTILVEVAARRQLANEVGIALNEAAFQAATELERSDGYGLRNMQERIAQIGGTLYIDSQPQHGTTVTIRITYR